MSLFDKNIQKLQEQYPALATKVRLHEPKESFPLEKTMDLLSGIQGQIKSRMCIFLGLGDGQALARLQKSIDAPHFVFMVIEKSLGKFISILHHQDLTACFDDPRISWFVGEELASLDDMFWDYFSTEARMMASGAILKLTTYLLSQDSDDASYYEAAMDTYLKSSNHRMFTMAAPAEDQYVGLINLLNNKNILPHIDDFDNLKDAFAGRAGIVVAAGPSLNQSLELLKKSQDKFIIFSCDATLKILLDHGITPHFVACLERVPETQDFFKNLPELPNTWLVGHPLVFPQTLEKYPGPKLFLHRNATLIDWFLPQVTTHMLGLSAAHMAYYGLSVMGCDPIILLGQDLAFDPYSDRSHASGVAEVAAFHNEALYKKIKDKKETSEEYLVEGNNGKMLYTDPDYKDFIRFYSMMIEKSGKKCVNAIPLQYGARIKGAERRDPEDVFKNLGTSDDRETRNTILQKIEERRCPRPDKDSIEKIRTTSLVFLREKFIPFISVLLHNMSQFRHLYEGSIRYHEDKFHRLMEDIQKQEHQFVLQNKEYYALISPFLSYHKIRTSLKIAQVLNEKRAFEKEWPDVLFALTDYYKESIFWMNRVMHLLMVS